MGLTEKRKEQFYAEFLRIPVYEDMATWNIQFKAQPQSALLLRYSLSLHAYHDHRLAPTHS
jgi:hypothetical protein